ncbi:hypothetical protein Tco_0496000 [Tanacetum coccineum]
MYALWSIESRCKGGDEVGSCMGKSGGIPDGGVPDGGVSTLVVMEITHVLVMILEVVVRESEVVVVILVVVIVSVIVVEKESEAIVMTMGKVVMVVE